MGRRRYAACAAPALLVLLAVAPAAALERKALIRGVSDRALLLALERAVGDERAAAASRLEARRRARDAAAGATALLRSEGYYDATVEALVEGEAKPRAAVRVEPGPRSTLVAPTVVYAGVAPDPAAADAARAALKLRPGAPGRAADVVAAEGRAVAALAEAGYADAAASPRRVVVDHAAHTVAATYRIAAGARVRLDGLRVSTTGRTDPAWVRRLKPWREGDAYRPEAVAELERRLTDTQVYDTVAVGLAPASQAGPDGRRPVVVSLADRGRRALDVSAGYSTSEGADFDVRYSVFNQLRRGDTLTIEARLAELDSRYGAELALPHFLAAGQTLTPSAYYFRTVTDAYTETGELLALDLTKRYGKTSFLTRGVSVTDSRVEDHELGGLDLIAVRLIGAFSYDGTDNALDPSRGFKADARAVPTYVDGHVDALAVPAYGASGVDRLYARLVAQASGYLSLDTAAGTVAAGRVRVGSLVGGSIPQVPAQDRFFAGGGGSVRGYEYQGVGPRYTDNTPRGGLSLAEASVELRHSFGASPFAAVAFFDAGAVGEHSYPDLRSVYTAAGVGARYSLGFAPVRADFAVPLSGSHGQQRFQIYLSIGQSF